MKKLMITALLIAATAGAGILGYRYIQQDKPAGTTTGTTDTSSTTTADAGSSDKAKGVINMMFGPAAGMMKYKSATTGADNSTIVKGIEFNIPTSPKPIKVDEMVVSKFDTENKPPLFYKIKISGLHMDQSTVPSPQMAIVLGTLQMSELVMDLEVDATMDPAAKTQTGFIEFTVRNIGKIRVDMNLTDFDMEAMKKMNQGQTPPNPMTLMGLFKVRKFKIKYSNLGLKDKLKTQLPPEMIKTAKTSLEAQIDQAKHPVQKLVLKAASDFLDKQNGFELSIEPSEPISLMAFQTIAPDKAISTLNFKVDVN